MRSLICRPRLTSLLAAGRSRPSEPSVLSRPLGRTLGEHVLNRPRCDVSLLGAGGRDKVFSHKSLVEKRLRRVWGGFWQDPIALSRTVFSPIRGRRAPPAASCRSAVISGRGRCFEACCC